MTSATYKVEFGITGSTAAPRASVHGIGRGETHASVDKLLEKNAQIRPLLALVLFDNAGKGGEVNQKVGGWGVWASEVLDTVIRGAHSGAGLMPLDELVPNTRKFCLRLRELAK